MGIRDGRSLLAQTLRLAWPAALQGLVLTVLFFTDRVLLGQYSADALASLQASGALLWSIAQVFTVFTVGTVAVAGRAHGAGARGEVAAIGRAVLLFAVALGLVIGGGGTLARHLLVDWVAGETASGEVRALAATYMGALFPFFAASFAASGATAIYQSIGELRAPMLAAAATALVNLALSWVLIYGRFGAPELGVVGAALGTGIAMACNAAVLIWGLARRRRRLGDAAPRSRSLRALRPVLSVSSSAFLERVVYHLGFLLYAALVGRLGDLAMAANQAAIAVESIGFISSEAIGMAAAALVAQRLGAGKPLEAERAGMMAVKLGVGVMCAVGALFAIAPHQLLRLISPDPEVVRLGATCLIAAAVAQPIMAATHSFGAALRGAGDTVTPAIAAVIGPGLVRLGATWFFAFHLEMGLLGVWLGSGCDWTVRLLWLGAVFRRGAWKRIEVVDPYRTTPRPRAKPCSKDNSSGASC